jgi:YHS domain-containing protein
MSRGLLFFLAVLVIYFAFKTVVRSAVRGYHENEQRRTKRIIGDEMVFDPECRTYVLKDRAVTRRIRGTIVYFCSEACAARYTDKNRA